LTVNKKSPTAAALQFSTNTSVVLLEAKLGVVQAPCVSTLTDERKSLPPRRMLAVWPYISDCTFAPVMTGSKTVEPPQALNPMTNTRPRDAAHATRKHRLTEENKSNCLD
jgi:hypothetical protein